MQITKGRISGAKKVLVYGPEGIGKTTFASHFPDPVFIDTEGSTKELDVARLSSPSSWTMLKEEVRYVIQNPAVCKTLVIDTADWAEKLAVWITNEENQTLRFEETGEGPANINAANSEKVKEAPAIRALTEQSRYSVVQNVGENFWDASTAFGMMMASGNRDGLNLQEILDQMVEKITAP